MLQHNWAGNIEFGAAQVHAPQTVEELQELVRGSRKVKVVGSGHSFNNIADTADTQISLERLAGERATPSAQVTFDHARGTVTCSAGITYGELCPLLHREGVALPNMASLPHITVAGACATATHGSGDEHGNLATAVVGLELVTADGELRTLSPTHDQETFQGAVVGLGGLGVVTKITLATVPAFSMQQEVYENMPVAAVYNHFDEIMSSGYSVSLFTDWQHGKVSQVWVKHYLAEGAAIPVAEDFYGATPAPTHRHPVTRLSPHPCTPQMGIPGPWHERLPHTRVGHTPASGDELQTEYFVPRSHAVEALQALEQLQEQFAPLLWISEVRSIAADRLWLSPSYGTPAVGIHFSWKRDWPAIAQLLPVIEATLAPFNARPHWGKLCTLAPAIVQARYPRMADFQTLLRTLDPQGTFRNAYLEHYIWG